MKRHLWLASLLLTGCVHLAPAPEVPSLRVDEVMPLLPAKVEDREGWARDLILALETQHLAVDLEHVCAVAAIAEQESGFQANPAVPRLPTIARRALDQKAKALGPLGPVALAELLDVTAPGEKKSFNQKIEALRTEADLDHLYRDLLAEHHRRHPVLYTVGDLGAALFDHRGFSERNPITTAGSMQVSVFDAEQRAASRHQSVEQVRDSLYTRAGGLFYGTARLWGFEAEYGKPLYRFADYNAGLYASRNAAFQEQLSALTGTPLALDGDLLAYDSVEEIKNEETKTLAALLDFRERFAPKLSEAQVRHDARAEKSAAFEQTRTWAEVKRAYLEKTGRPASYARLPEVTLRSPKLTHDLSTAWFAQAVEKRYLACLDRAPR